MSRSCTANECVWNNKYNPYYWKNSSNNIDYVHHIIYQLVMLYAGLVYRERSSVIAMLGPKVGEDMRIIIIINNNISGKMLE